MLYLFNATETLISTLPRGSYFDALHREVLNGENLLQFSFPANEAGAEYIQEGNLVGFQDLDAYWQLFEIKRIVDRHGERLTRTAFCEHIFYELLDDIVVDKRPSAGALAALESMLENTRWQVGIVDDLGISSTSAYYESALLAVQKVANAWRGEMRWRILVSNNKITERRVDLLKMRGTDTGKQFAYAKDIINIEREVDSSNIVTALYGRGRGVETESGAGYGRRLTFASVEAPDKPLGQEWVGDLEALARWGRNGRHRFDVFIDEDETDPEKLLEKTRVELSRRKIPRITYRLDVISLEELTGYEHETMRLGDLVRIIDREFKPELTVSARVIELERDLLVPENTKVLLGSFTPTIIEATFNTQKRVYELENRPFNTKWLDGVIDVLQNAIENTQAYVFETPQGTLHLNAPTYEEATEAMLLGGGRFAIANQKDGQGGWNWRTFGDGSGFTADEITTGKLKAELVQIGPETTFAPGYDPTQIEGGISVGMGVDSDCVGLWHFDGSLNSHKGIAAVLADIYTNKIIDGTFSSLLNWNNAGILITNDGVFNNTCVDYGYAWNCYHELANRLINGRYYFISAYGRVVSGEGEPRISYAGTNPGSIILGKNSTDWHRFGEKVVCVDATAPFFRLLYNGTDGGRARFDGVMVVEITAGEYNNLSVEQLMEKYPFTEGTSSPSPVFSIGRFGQALSVSGGGVKIPTESASANQGTIALRAKNLSGANNNSIILDIPNADNSAGAKVGINNDGNIYLSDADKVSVNVVESTRQDFEQGTFKRALARDEGFRPYVFTKPNFTREYGAFRYDGAWVEEDQPRYENTLSGKGIMVEEGTTNLLTNPSFEKSSGEVGTGWSKYIGSEGISYELFLSGDPVKSGSRSQKITINSCTSPGSVNVLQEVPVLPNENYAFSLWTRGSLNQYAQLFLIIDCFDTNGNWLGAESAHFSNLDNNEWHYSSGVIKTPANTVKITFYIQVWCEVGAHGYVYVDNAQLEKKPYPTTFTESNRFPEVLSMPIATLSPQQGSIVVKLSTRNNLVPTLDSWKRIWGIGGSRAPGMFVLRYVPGLDKVVFSIFDDENNEQAIEYSYSNAAGKWTVFTARWNSSKMELFVDHIKVGEILNPSLPTNFLDDKIGIGCRVDLKSDHINAIFDYVYLFDRSITDEDVYNISYNNDFPLTEDVIYKAVFENNLDFGSSCVRENVFDISTAKPALDSVINWETNMPPSSMVKVLTAISTDGGSSYTDFKEATLGGKISDLDGKDLTDARLKVRFIILANDGSLESWVTGFSLSIIEVPAKTSVGPHKSNYVDWDFLALSWKPEALCLVINDEQVCFLENPTLLSGMGNYITVGYLLNSYIDELRLDKVFRDANTRIAWYRIGSPFYTSDEMKQWPGYVKIESEGMKVYDSQASLRVLLGSWLRDAVRRYGLKVLGGEIYGTRIRTGEEGDTSYVGLDPGWSPLTVVVNNKTALNVFATDDGFGGSIQFYNVARNDMRGQISPVDDAQGDGLRIHARTSHGADKDIIFWASSVEVDSSYAAFRKWTGGDVLVDVNGTLWTKNLITSHDKNALVFTNNYGARLFYSVEAPEALFYDRGVTNLNNGEATVQLDPVFLESIEPNTPETPWQIWVQSYAKNEVYVDKIGDDFFTIKERNNGTNNAKVIWRFEATRKDYTGVRLHKVFEYGDLLENGWEDEILEELENAVVIDEDVLTSGWEDEILEMLGGDWDD